MADQVPDTAPAKLTPSQRIDLLEMRVKFWQATALLASYGNLKTKDVQECILFKTDEHIDQARVDALMLTAKAAAGLASK